jgi:hypothetical protein
VVTVIRVANGSAGDSWPIPFSSGAVDRWVALRQTKVSPPAIAMTIQRYSPGGATCKAGVRNRPERRSCDRKLNSADEDEVSAKRIMRIP